MAEWKHYGRAVWYQLGMPAKHPCHLALTGSLDPRIRSETAAKANSSVSDPTRAAFQILGIQNDGKGLLRSVLEKQTPRCLPQV